MSEQRPTAPTQHFPPTPTPLTPPTPCNMCPPPDHLLTAASAAAPQPSPNKQVRLYACTTCDTPLRLVDLTVHFGLAGPHPLLPVQIHHLPRFPLHPHLLSLIERHRIRLNFVLPPPDAPFPTVAPRTLPAHTSSNVAPGAPSLARRHAIAAVPAPGKVALEWRSTQRARSRAARRSPASRGVGEGCGATRSEGVKRKRE